MLRPDHHFAKALRRERKLKGWSVAELARGCRVSRSTAASWEVGSEPSTENFNKLVGLFPCLTRFKPKS
jgi:transcriptional regulator with XRE-family HTH domain